MGRKGHQAGQDRVSLEPACLADYTRELLAAPNQALPSRELRHGQGWSQPHIGVTIKDFRLDRNGVTGPVCVVSVLPSLAQVV